MGAPLPAAVQAALEKLPDITSIAQLQSLANGLSANASGPNAILYSGGVNLANGASASSNAVAQSISAQTGWSLINNTDRALFLADGSVMQRAVQIFIKNGDDG